MTVRGEGVVDEVRETVPHRLQCLLLLDGRYAVDERPEQGAVLLQRVEDCAKDGERCDGRLLCGRATQRWGDGSRKVVDEPRAPARFTVEA